MTASPQTNVLLVRCGSRLCALAVADVVETLRPRPVSPLAGTPPFVTGAAVIRGDAMPVVDLAAFLGDAAGATPGRFVIVRCGGSRRAALAVRSVVGVTEARAQPTSSAPLLDSACAGAIEALAGCDGALLVVLRAARIVPEEAWQSIAPDHSA